MALSPIGTTKRRGRLADVSSQNTKGVYMKAQFQTHRTMLRTLFWFGVILAFNPSNLQAQQRWRDTDLTAMTGASNARRSVAVAFDPNFNTMRTHYIGVDSHVHELGFRAGQRWDADLTAITGAPSARDGLAIAFDPVWATMRTHYVADD